MKPSYRTVLFFIIVYFSVGLLSACRNDELNIPDFKEVTKDDSRDIKTWFDYLCSIELGGRYSGSTGIIKAMNYISDVIGISDALEIDHFDTDKCEMNNIIFHINGVSDSLIVLGAHYDAFGYVNNTPFPGADDNMSGVAVLLRTIKYIQDSNFQPNYSIDIVFFDGEEIGRYGSYHYLSNCKYGIKEYINVDTCGNRDFGIELLYDGKHPLMEDESLLYKGMVPVINKWKIIEYNPKGYTTDCEPFLKNNIPFLSIQNDTQNDYNHTIYDDESNISFWRLEFLAKGLEKYLRLY